MHRSGASDAPEKGINSVSFGTLALVTLGVAGVGMFAAGAAVLIAGRRGSKALAPSTVRSRS